jgi:hypothetical protein
VKCRCNSFFKSSIFKTKIRFIHRKAGEDIDDDSAASNRQKPSVAPEKGAKFANRPKHSFAISNLYLLLISALREDYVNFVGDMMYPKRLFGPYGYSAEKGRVR